jgi:uncharacterized OB-fold protein
VLERLPNPEAIRLWPGSIPVSHRYTAGVAGERFFGALRDRGAFLATRCPSCNLVYCPARTFCERCFAALDEELDVGPEGRLESFTVAHVGLDGPLETPVIVGLVRLTGADTCLVHRVAAGPGELRIGMAVEAVLKPAEARTGSLEDVEFFRAVASPGSGGASGGVAR